jgi:NADH:ubiquinone reductase (H+-translocating)
MSSPWKVVIVGGGFGGLNAAQQLKSDRVDVTLIDRRNYHLFQPLLYQVATGSLAAGEIAAPLRSVFRWQRNTRVLLGNVVDVDPDSKHVFLEDGAVLDYNSLIVAAGSQTSYFAHNDWEQWAPGMKSVEEATTIRHKILYAFEVAERIDDPEVRREWLTFVSSVLVRPAWNWRARLPRSPEKRSRTSFVRYIRKKQKSSCWTGRPVC